MIKTINNTTVASGHSSATVIASSINAEDVTITTLELVYPRFIHSELMTHRVFSRNASSSRATPLSVTLNEVRTNPVFFDEVGINNPGMVSKELLDPESLSEFHKEWNELALLVADKVEGFKDKYNIHKQVLNRLLEPFSYIKVLVTATEWDNFFKLRLAEDAQPEMRNLALAMIGSLGLSTPSNSQLHTPYVTDEEVLTLLNSEYSVEDILKVSGARCARVSYLKHNESKSSVIEDLELAEKLILNGHYSPLEHPCYSMNNHHKYSNIKGWKSFRDAHIKPHELA